MGKEKGRRLQFQVVRYKCLGALRFNPQSGAYPALFLDYYMAYPYRYDLSSYPL